MERISRRAFLKIIGGIVSGSGSSMALASGLDSSDYRQPPKETLQVVLTYRLPIPVEEIPVWGIGDRPSFISIGQIGFESNDISLARFTWRDEKTMTYEVPEFGVATPEIPFKNLIYIFGHSRAKNGVQDFARIEDLDRGNIFEVRNENGKAFHFMVSDFKLVNPYKAVLGNLENLQVTLQTTAIDSPSAGWILKEAKVLSKVGENRPADLKQPLVLMVDAKPVVLSGLS